MIGGTTLAHCRIDILVAYIIFLRGTYICGLIILINLITVHGCFGSWLSYILYGREAYIQVPVSSQQCYLVLMLYTMPYTVSI